MHTKVTPVILCGGSGARLWPLSRSGFPKQFLSLYGKNSLFQQSVERVNSFKAKDISINETLVVTGEEHRFIALDQLKEISSISYKLILEPYAKNTAPALTLAALQSLKNTDDSVLLVTPADQIIENTPAFIDTVERAIKVANTGSIVVLGITPEGPETGFGYIQQSKKVGSFGAFDVKRFVEKPSIENAKTYIDSGDFSWNGGIFVVKASVWINAISNFRNDIFVSTSEAFNNSLIDNHFIRPNDDLFTKINSESIDYAVMEKCPGSEFEIKVIQLDASWSDLGSWDSVWEHGKKDHYGNMIYGDVLVDSSKNNLIHSSHRLVAAVGVNNLIVVETPDAVLVADNTQSQFVKKIVNQLSDRAREEHILHRRVSRPWGWYDTIDVGENFKVKRIQVKPGHCLSLQKHEHRAEHWIVIKGVAEITNGKKVSKLNQNQSTYIPVGEIHRLRNPGDDVLEIIEVQSGAYLGEDDIFRFEDTYGRCD